MRHANAYLLLHLAEQHYALPVASVERVVRAVAVTPLPEAPDIVAGVITVAGRILPVIDLRKKLRLPDRPLSPDVRFVIVNTSQRLAVFAVDSVTEIIQIPDQELVAATSLLPSPGALRGLTVNNDEIILIEDPDLLLAATDNLSLPTTVPDQQQGESP